VYRIVDSGVIITCTCEFGEVRRSCRAVRRSGSVRSGTLWCSRCPCRGPPRCSLRTPTESCRNRAGRASRTNKAAFNTARTHCFSPSVRLFHAGAGLTSTGGVREATPLPIQKPNGAPRRTHWTHVRPKEFLTKFIVVSISTASLLEVVFRHFRVWARLWFPSNPSSASNFWKSVGAPTEACPLIHWPSSLRKRIFCSV